MSYHVDGWADNLWYDPITAGWDAISAAAKVAEAEAGATAAAKIDAATAAGQARLEAGGAAARADIEAGGEKVKADIEQAAANAPGIAASAAAPYILFGVGGLLLYILLRKKR